MVYEFPEKYRFHPLVKFSQFLIMDLTGRVMNIEKGRGRMNEAFMGLSEEKRQRIINGALEVFARYDYKQALTDDIAAKAGISKGSLFYYFKDKRELYLYLVQYAEETIQSAVVDPALLATHDFFEFLVLGAKRKMEAMIKNPYLLDFSIRAYYTSHEKISQDVSKKMGEKQSSLYENYFSHIDQSKFREGVSVEYVLQMLVWMTDGYLHDKRMRGLSVRSEDIMEEFDRWVELFRRLVYKEEYCESN